MMRREAEDYRLDRQDGQEEYLEVVVEARGAVEQVWRTTSPYSVPVYSGSGFSTVSSLREAVLRAEEREVPTTILVLGDLDPSGIDIRSRVREDIAAFALEHDCDIAVQEIALTEEQVENLELIKAPMPASKRQRFPWWPHPWSVELEALAPEELATILRDELEARTSATARQELREREEDERDQLIRDIGGEEDER